MNRKAYLIYLVVFEFGQLISNLISTTDISYRKNFKKVTKGKLI